MSTRRPISTRLCISTDGASVDEIPVTDLVAPLVVIDIAARAAENRDAQVTPDDLQAWIDANGEIPDRACVAMHSGWAAKSGSAEDFVGRDADGVGHFPGFHVEAAQMLLETGAASIASDTLSLDHGPSADFATHYAWLPTGRFGIENLAGLENVPRGRHADHRRTQSRRRKRRARAYLRDGLSRGNRSASVG